MIKKILSMTSFFLLGSGAFYVNAQNAFVASGGDASNSNGTVNYTVGQTIYSASSSGSGSVNHGIQQIYTISVVLSQADQESNILLTAFPNPTLDYLNLHVELFSLDNLQYQVSDAQGNVLGKNNLTSSDTKVSLHEHPAAIYFLTVTKSNKTIKTFKIVKN